MQKKIVCVFGTRPEAIKMAPLIKQLQGDPFFDCRVCVTGQHRQMLDQVLRAFAIVPDVDLDIMRDSQSISYITQAVVQGMSDVLAKDPPDLLLVHGDTTTSFAAALAGFYAKIPVGHVEAGLRTHNPYSPFPEEMNRALTGRLATLHFAPTEQNKANLALENIHQGVYVTGNTVIDAFAYTVRPCYSFESQEVGRLDFDGKRVLLVTAHRRENLGAPLRCICMAVRRIAQTFADVCIVYPMHKNPAVRETVRACLGDQPNVHLIEPLSVIDLHNLMAKCYFILTDSGGIQEEAPALHKPVLVLRTQTERPELVELGGAMLTGVQEDTIYACAARLLTDQALHTKMQKVRNPYGDGDASAQIARSVKRFFEQQRGEAPCM